jgi:hypothetical protein
MDVKSAALADRLPLLASCPEAIAWLCLETDLGLAARTIEAYGRGLADYLGVCKREGKDPMDASRADVARYVRDLTTRPNPRGASIVALDSGVGLANATLQQRLVPVRLFYDYLIEEGRRESNPVGRGRHTPGFAFGVNASGGWCRASPSCRGFHPGAMGRDFGSGQSRAAAQ